MHKGKTFFHWLLAVWLLLAMIGAALSGESGRIWTRIGGCDKPPQNANHYKAGMHIWIAGSKFAAGDYRWSITGQPGGASCDANTVVASGSVHVNDDGLVCIDAYVVQDDDCGEYKAEVGGKKDNYRVDKKTQTLTIIKKIEGINPASLSIPFKVVDENLKIATKIVNLPAGPDKSGSVEFTVTPGSYTILEPDISGFEHVGNNQQTVLIGDDKSTTVTFINKAVSSTVVEPVGGKWNDLNKNGKIDSDEPLMGGWTIDLENTVTHVITKVQTISTAGDADYGKWYFPAGLPEGKYQVTEEQQKSWMQSYPPGGSYTVQYSGDGRYNLVGAEPPNFDGLDFGNYVKLGSEPAGSKWNDENRNGLKENGESLIGGWTITIENNSTHATVSVQTVSAASDPLYGQWFLPDDLPAGNYRITEAQKSGWVQSYPPSGFYLIKYSSDGHYQLLGKEPPNFQGLDFGNYTDKPEGSKWNDLNGNGVEDPGEPRLGGWTIDLENIATHVITKVQTLSEVGDPEYGKWFFPASLQEGKYRITEEQQEGWKQSYPPSGFYLIHYFADGSCQLDETEPALPASHELDFGNLYIGCVEGYVNVNGVGQSGVVVILDNDQMEPVSQITDQDGHFYFKDVSIGVKYELTVEGCPDCGITFKVDNNQNGCFSHIFYTGGKIGFSFYGAAYSGPIGNQSSPQVSSDHETAVGGPGYGLSDIQDQHFAEFQILLAWAADIDAFVVDYFGKDTYDLTPIQDLLDATQRLKSLYGDLGFDFKIMICYNENAVGAIEENLQFLRDHVLIHPAHWNIANGNPYPLFVLSPKHLLDPKEFTDIARRILPGSPFILWDWAPEQQTRAQFVQGLYPWVQASDGLWDPNGQEWGGLYLKEFYNNTEPLNLPYSIGAIWPGYDDRQWIHTENHYIAEQDTLVYQWTWDKAFQYQPKWLIIESWLNVSRFAHMDVPEGVSYKFIKMTRNKMQGWKSIYARDVKDEGLLWPKLLFEAREAGVKESVIDQALSYFFLRNYDSAYNLLEAALHPEPLPPSGFQLSFVQGSKTDKGEGWDNAVDGDFGGWNGTTTAKIFNTSGSTYAIFQFSDQNLHTFDSIFLQTDNGSDDDAYANRQVTDIEVLASAGGMQAADFSSVLRIQPKSGDLHRYALPAAVTAQYLKLVVYGPTYSRDQWCQLVEFAVGDASLYGASLFDQSPNVAQKPDDFALEQNYPNPFNATTTIRYALPEDAMVHLTIYDIRGNVVDELVSGNQSAGYQSVVWKAAGAASGIYYYRLQAGDRTFIRRLVLLK